MDKVLISNSQGESGIVNVVRYFNNNGIEYLIYSLNEVDESGYTRLYVAKLNGVDGVYSADIPNEAEWEEIKGIVKTIVKANKEGTPVPVQDLNPKKINNVMLKDKKVFKLNAPLVNDLASNKPNFGNEETNISQSEINPFATPTDPVFEQPVQPSFETQNINEFNTSSFESTNTDALKTPSFEMSNTNTEMNAGINTESFTAPSFEMPNANTFNATPFDVSNTNTEMNTGINTESFTAPSFEMPSVNTDAFTVPSFEIPNANANTFTQPSFEIPNQDSTFNQTFDVTNNNSFGSTFATSNNQSFDQPYNLNVDSINQTNNVEDYQTLYNNQLEQNRNMQNEIDRLNTELTKYKNMIANLKEIIEK